MNTSPQNLNKPLISIITVTYNTRQGLQQTIQSVKTQSFSDLEHIIVDNLSNDGTEKLVREYQQAAPYPVIYIRESDTGIYNAMNKGLRVARGQWINFLNSADVYVTSQVLSKIVIPRLNDASKLLVSFGVRMTRNGRTEDIVSGYDPETKRLLFHHQPTFFSSALFAKYGLYDERYKVVADTVYIIRYCQNIAQAVYPEVVVAMAPAGVSTKYRLRNQYERMLLHWIYFKTPWRKKIKILFSFIKQFILECTKKKC